MKKLCYQHVSVDQVLLKNRKVKNNFANQPFDSCNALQLQKFAR